MTPSQAYVGLLGKFESLAGAVPTAPGLFTWYFDSAGICTVGYGHVLHHPTLGREISRKLDGGNAPGLADQALVKYYGSTQINMTQVLALKTLDMTNFSDDVSPLVSAATTQTQFDMLLDFAYNAGVEGLRGSTLLRLHNSGSAEFGTQDIGTLAQNSQNKVAITTIGDAFCAWSNSGGAWTLGVFHRRACEFLIYTGMDYNSAYNTAFSYHQ